MEKDYKSLYEKALAKNRKMKGKIAELKDTIEELRAERLSCDIEYLKGELFGKTIDLVSIGGQKYVRAEVWTTDSKYDGHIIGTSEPRKYMIFLRCDDILQPIPSWCEEMDLNFVVARGNEPRVVLNPPEGQPIHLLIDGDLWAWEAWHEELVSNLQLEHDRYYLNKCRMSALCYGPV